MNATNDNDVIENNEDTESKIQETLMQEIPEQNISNDLKTEDKPFTEKVNEDIISNTNDKVLLQFLSPEITNNEQTKRKHKYILIALLTVCLSIQFYSVHKITIKVIDYSILETANETIVKALLKFVSAYITSVIIELIAILRYIVVKVFDTSIADLIKIFRNNNNDKKDKKKEQEN